ncbi:dipeptide ABC transporter ATP-binding protein [Frisingicoccus caecimuris]|uniref:Oligopeptide transport system ATP-binding protein n=1 Tax=Frisingicoccus caecimuris TaxID=1796636 RepID=A0A4V2SDX9_9FIRM|nr:dipeptide ABC transporter ATP-binding protein [Frisingicoccus caecimuris]MCR1917536.1 dipeptide ABC transporter ATP-binding protein [Frisingicoccus caecimuris]TCO85806.1 oligopeptide transport system ATP-binding protein [Frisingicoccus caecimuris]HAP19796.1 peptide ABC transporter substrate-binding protein [Lachnospiraceae bacterium]
MTEKSKTPLLEVKDLKKWFPAKKSPFSREKVFIKAVDGVSFTLNEGETLGVVGESGCGKSTMGRSVLRLLEPTGGQVIFNGVDYTALKDKELRDSRKDLQIIFQDPYASLDPRMTIGDIIAEPLDIQLKLPAKERMQRVLETMERAGLNTRFVNRYPHEFSGGQRQRIGIARAIVLNPKIMVCDEPVSALDVSIQAQVINLLMDLQKEMGMAYIFISHDLSVIKHISDRVAVMYLGHLVEIADKKDIYAHPMHPYTVALLSAIPVPDRKHKKEKIVLEGDLPSPANPPSGCVFHTRCYKAQDICKTEVPELKDCGNGHCCACHFPE